MAPAAKNLTSLSVGLLLLRGLKAITNDVVDTLELHQG